MGQASPARYMCVHILIYNHIYIAYDYMCVHILIYNHIYIAYDVYYVDMCICIEHVDI